MKCYLAENKSSENGKKGSTADVVMKCMREMLIVIQALTQINSRTSGDRLYEIKVLGMCSCKERQNYCFHYNMFNKKKKNVQGFNLIYKKI